jgi:hypothetical protein
MMPQTNSLAVDFVTNNTVAAPLPFDERGSPRAGLHPDAGACERQMYSASGRVLLGTNGLAGVLISATNASAVTDASGNYVIFISTNGAVLKPALTGYTFAPASLFASGTTNNTGLNFTATPVVSIGVATNGDVQVSFTGTNALQFRVEASTNLTNWATVYTNTAPFQYTDPNQTNFPSRFYRLTQ